MVQLWMETKPHSIQQKLEMQRKPLKEQGKQIALPRLLVLIFSEYIF